MSKTKKATGSTRTDRKFVKLTRAHLEMSRWLTGDDDKRYTLTALCVRREGDAAVVEATNGRMAWRYPAELTDAKELPALRGEGLADRQQVLLDPGTVKLCLSALPKHHQITLHECAYLAVEEESGVLQTLAGASFPAQSAGTSWPRVAEIVPERSGPCVTLSAELLYKIMTWTRKLSHGSEVALALSFSVGSGDVVVRFDTTRDDGPVGVLAPIKIVGDPMGASMPAWEAAFAEALKGGGE